MIPAEANPDLLDRVRLGCKEVAEGAAWVHLEPQRIATYASSLPRDRLKSMQMDPNHHFLGHGEATVAFFLVLDAINFGSGYFPRFRKRPGLSGYSSVAASLNDYFRRRGALAASELVRMKTMDCTRIFRQDPAEETILELMELFARALNDLGRMLLERFRGRFIGLVEEARESAERLVALLIEMPFFNDVEEWGGIRIPFFKRAQLSAADLHIAFGGSGPGRFRDIDRLTVFADNLLPHVLRHDGILRYEKKLADRIDREEAIPAGSPEEVEIRACAVHAAELLVAALRKEGVEINAMELDNFLWHRGQGPEYRGKPRHRTRTVFY